MSDTVTELAELLEKADRPADFCVSGVAETFPPALKVEGVGSIALPLLPVQARELIAAAERAPYGKGPDTIVDTAVRNCWQMEPDRVTIGGRHWPATMQTLLGRIAEGLGIADPIEAEFYKLLIYDRGSFFVPHRDTEKSPGMFATLVIVLPSFSSGGELVVKHKDRTERLEMRTEDPSEVAFAAFYADCLHEVRPVTEGCRLTLVYNLIRRGKGRAPSAPDYGAEQDKVTAVLRAWCDDLKAGDGGPEKLVYPLSHAYTAPELDFSVLKGADAAAAGVLAAAAERADCALHLALLTMEESGIAEYSDNYRPRGRRWSGYHDDDDDNDQFEVGEVTEGSVALSDWHAWDGNPVSWGDIPVEEDEFSPPDPFADLEPDELNFQEASGNAGVSFERSYRRAALVVWPKDRTLAVLTQAGLGTTIPHLADLAERWVTKGEQAVWQEAHELAGHMIGQWPQHGGYLPETEDTDTTKFLLALTQLRDNERVSNFMTAVVAEGRGYGKRDNPALTGALRLLPSDEAVALLGRVVTAHAASRYAACADLLLRAQSLGGLTDAAKTLLALLPRDGTAVSHVWSGRPEAVDASFVADLLAALDGIDAVLADRAVTHILAAPKTFDMDNVLVPAAVQGPNQAAMGRLRSACLAHLRARIAEPLAPPADWQRPSTVGCACNHCSALSAFLADGTQKVWMFRAVANDREHVEGTVKTARCDVDMTTLRKGSPHTLICTKNQASYERRAAQRRQDLANEAKLAG